MPLVHRNQRCSRHKNSTALTGFAHAPRLEKSVVAFELLWAEFEALLIVTDGARTWACISPELSHALYAIPGAGRLPSTTFQSSPRLPDNALKFSFFEDAVRRLSCIPPIAISSGISVLAPYGAFRNEF